MKNIRMNALANFFVRVLNFVFPFITTPYITRLLDREALGIYNGSYNLLNLLVPFATFGAYYYGVRQISKVKHDQDKVNYFFSTLFYITLVASLVTTACYLAYVMWAVPAGMEQAIYLILATQLLSSFLYIEWMNEAMEDYRFILLKTFFMRVLMVVLLYGFVRKSEDILAYSVIMSVFQIINYLLSFIWIKRQVRLVRVPVKEMLKLILPLLGLLLMANANTLYTTLDKMFLTTIGRHVRQPELVSYYTYGQTISVTIANLVIAPVMVSIPRLGYYLGNKDEVAYRNLVYKGSQWFSFLMVPIAFGLFVTGPYANFIYAGPKYLAAGTLTAMFGLRLITWSLEAILSQQVLFVHGYERVLTKLYFACGGLNLLLKIGLYVAGVDQVEWYLATTWLAEVILIGLESYYIRRYQLVDIKQLLVHFMKYSIYAVGFIPIAEVIQKLYPTELVLNQRFFVSLLLIMVSCSVYYGCVLFVRRDEVFLSTYQAIGKKIGFVKDV